MKINKLVFFNHYRNGDCFINRNYVRDIIDQIGIDQVYYAHNNHTTITQDLPVTHIRTDNLGSKIHQAIKIGYDQQENTLYINTWVGATVPKYFNWGQHANFIILEKIWQEYYQALGLEFRGDYTNYLPGMNFDKYDLTIVNHWLDHNSHRPFILVCNGQQQSDQSDLGNMENIIPVIAEKYPDRIFLVCDKLKFVRENVYYADDIFNSPVGNLPYITYLSQYADIIVGKNSGPFSFSHLDKNLNNPNKTFLCFSKDFKSCLTGEGIYYARTLFSDQISDSIVTKIIEKVINMGKQPGTNRPAGMQRIQ